jgi:hypothetical protein
MTDTMISIEPFPRKNQRRIRTRSRFFMDEVIINVLHDRIMFRKPSIDYSGKTHKLYKNPNYDWFYTTLYCEIPVGEYEFDKEESNEDYLVAYFKEKVEE